MIKNYIIFLLIAYISFAISLKSGQIEFDEEIDFDENNSEFNFENEGEDTAFFLMTINPTENTKIKYTCGTQGRSENAFEITSFGLKLNKAEFCNIILSVDDGKVLKGKIKVHPLKKEIPVDLTKKTEFKGLAQSYDECPPLIYSVSNITEDIKFKFNFEPTKVTIVDKTFILSNPFQVCGGKCEGDVKTYKFSKGKNYKINIKFEEIKPGTGYTTKYYFPGFSFEKTSKSDNIKIKLSLISLLLLLIC